MLRDNSQERHPFIARCAFLGFEIELAPSRAAQWPGDRCCLLSVSLRQVKRFTNSRLKRKVARPASRASISQQFCRRGDWRGQQSEKKVAALASPAFPVADHGRYSYCAIELRPALS